MTLPPRRTTWSVFTEEPPRFRPCFKARSPPWSCRCSMWFLFMFVRIGLFQAEAVYKHSSGSLTPVFPLTDSKLLMLKPPLLKLGHASVSGETDVGSSGLFSFCLCVGCWVSDKEEHRAAERARFRSWGCLSADGGRQGTNICTDDSMFRLPPEDSGLPAHAQWFRSVHSSDETQGGFLHWCVVIRVDK